MPLSESLFAVLADPNVAYILFIIGIIGLVAEYAHPGTLVPGILGALALALAIVGFIGLGVSWLGVALVLLAAGLFIAEAHTPGFGLLAVGGALAFVAGSWLLFVPSGARVSPWLIALATLALGGFFLIVVRAALRTRHLPVTSGAEALPGKEGVALSDLAPRGTVRVADEDWSAIAAFEPIKAGEAVEVLAVEGVTLRVRRPYEWKLPELSSKSDQS